jgi:ABC-2 type transport system ATP-binding protein
MSGLDPLGRRDVRALILELRDRGCTVFFSSHILSDAEAICSRVAILVGGQLVTTGRLSEILAFEVSGWELVMSGLMPEAIAGLGSRARGVTRISDGRYAIELAPDTEPERLVAELRAAGAGLVSLNPVRTTLEDYFVQQVTARKGAPPPGRAMPEG